jgi:3',5'-cyclic AMP phosphodiesterase CpdA
VQLNSNRTAFNRFAFLWIAVLVSGCASQELTFVVTSDIHESTQPENGTPARFKAVAEAIRSVGPGDFMVTSGDMVYAESVRATLDAILGRQYPWYPAPGNHDIEKPENMAWLREYNAGGRKLPHIVRSGPPGAVETCYSFDYGNAHFVAVNEYFDGQRDDMKGGDVSDALYRWLAEDLSANRKPIVFVIGHEPYLALVDMDTGQLRHRGDSLDANEANQRRFWSLLRKHHVTAFICGHTHCVSVTKFNGVWQLNCGRSPEPGNPNKSAGFLRIRIDSDRVYCDVYRDTGSGKTPWQLTYSEQLR